MNKQSNSTKGEIEHSHTINENSNAIRGGIKAHGLVKRYGATIALDGLDLTVPEGTILGLFGPNRAGHAIVAGADVTTSPNRVRERIELSGQHATSDTLEPSLSLASETCLTLPAGSGGSGAAHVESCIHHDSDLRSDCARADTDGTGITQQQRRSLAI